MHVDTPQSGDFQNLPFQELAEGGHHQKVQVKRAEPVQDLRGIDGRRLEHRKGELFCGRFHRRGLREKPAACRPVWLGNHKEDPPGFGQGAKDRHGELPGPGKRDP